MTQRKTAITKLRQMIEHLTLARRLPFASAAKVVVQDPENFEVLVTALGGWWKPKKLPSPTIIRGWRDPMKLALAKRYPDLTPEELVLAAPYLPQKLRPKTNHLIDKALTFLDKGFSYSDVAEMLEVTPTHLYKIVPKFPDKSWKKKALELYTQDPPVPVPEIARRLDKPYRNVRYLLTNPKSKNTNYPRNHVLEKSKITELNNYEK